MGWTIENKKQMMKLIQIVSKNTTDTGLPLLHTRNHCKHLQTLIITYHLSLNIEVGSAQPSAGAIPTPTIFYQQQHYYTTGHANKQTNTTS
jgi:hypothetical protein